MARMRTLKPSFFTNEVLAELPPLGRLLFQGLWCLADRAGRLEDRPLRIKAEVLPYDAADVDGLLGELASRGFIARYEVDGGRYIQVARFARHQSPNAREADSILPPSPAAGPSPEPGDTNLHVHARESTCEKSETDHLMGEGTGTGTGTVVGTGGTRARAETRTPSAETAPSAARRVLRELCEEGGDDPPDELPAAEVAAVSALLGRCRGDEGEALEYLRWRVARGRGAPLRFAAEDYVPTWRRAQAPARASPGDGRATMLTVLRRNASGGGGA